MLRAIALLCCLPAVALAQTSAPPDGVVHPLSAVGFGTSAAMADSMLYLGRPGTLIGFPVPTSDAGVVFAYRRTADGWVPAAELAPPARAPADLFGAALALSSEYLVVGAPGDGAGKGGAVWVFSRTGGATAATQLPHAASAPGDRFGSSVGIRGTTILVGAPGAGDRRGAAVAYHLRGNRWVEGATVSAASRDTLDGFGESVAVGSRFAFVGAPGQSPVAGLGQLRRNAGHGAIYSYPLTGTNLSTPTVMTSSDTAVASLGWALLEDNGALWAGAPTSHGGNGAVLRMEVRGHDWNTTATLLPSSAGSRLTGFALARAGDDLIVGAPFSRGTGGAALVFRRNADGDWTEAEKLEPTITGIAGLAGFAVAAADTRAVVGTPMTSFFAGLGHAYRKEDGGWKEGEPVVDRDPGLAAVRGGEQKCEQGTAGEFSCSNVDLVAFLPTQSFGAPRGIMMNDLWGWTDPETGHEIAIVGRMDATVFLDVTDAANPVWLGTLPLTEGARPNLWRDMKVYKDHAFIVSDGAGPHGMQVFDLRRLRHVTAPPETFAPDTVYRGINSAHNIVINEASGFAYTVGNSSGGETCGGALHMIDIRDPRHPTFAGCFADTTMGNNRTGGTHDAECVTYAGPDTRYRGYEICFTASETALGIADVTDKSAPRAIGRVTHPTTQYVHQGWLSDDQRYFFVNDEGDEVAGTVPRTRTLVYDVSDLEDPIVKTEFLGTTSASDHNLYVKGRYMYQSNYVAGLRIIDVADPEHPVEVGFFDTVPTGANAPGFAGSWSNYPFFKSGTIVVTSMREGVFLLRHRPDAPVP